MGGDAMGQAAAGTAGCPDCGRLVSARAQACPGCGRPIRRRVAHTRGRAAVAVVLSLFVAVPLAIGAAEVTGGNLWLSLGAGVAPVVAALAYAARG